MQPVTTERAKSLSAGELHEQWLNLQSEADDARQVQMSAPDWDGHYAPSADAYAIQQAECEAQIAIIIDELDRRGLIPAMDCI